MYETSTQISGLGLSLKPPQWLRDLGARVISQTHVSVPTPAGSVVVDLGDPTQLAQIRQAITGAQVQVGPRAPSPLEQLNAGVGTAVPGGWGTIAVAAGALLLLMARRRRRR